MHKLKLFMFEFLLSAKNLLLEWVFSTGLGITLNTAASLHCPRQVSELFLFIEYVGGGIVAGTDYPVASICI